MKVLSEEKLCAYLTRVLDLSGDVLKGLPSEGTQPAGDEVLDRYQGLIDDLKGERESVTYLSDEAWNWIWEGKPSYNLIHIYGRLAWINLQLLELL